MSREIEERAIAAVIAYETEHDRTAHKVKQGKGYDVFSEGHGEERHIEVKGQSSNELPGFIRLYHTVGKQLLNDPDFWIYLVHSINQGTPQVIPISRIELTERRITPYINFSITFTKADWDKLVQKSE